MARTTKNLDETTVGATVRTMSRRSGFIGERISVLPRLRVAEALEHPVTSRLLVTDSGYFPHAADHDRARPHGADEAIVIVCVEGVGWCEVAGVRHRVCPGQVVALAPHTPHRYGASDDDPWSVWWVHVLGSDVADLVGSIGATPAQPVVDVPDLPRAVALLEEVVAGMERDDLARTLQMGAGAAWNLLALLSVSPYQLSRERTDPTQVAISFIQHHYGEKLTVPQLAGMVGLSTSHFAALFRRATGCGPREYQTRLRMLKARQLLDTTDLPVSSVARNVGYDDPFHFARQFRAAHGVTASEHRSRSKG
jgi:AraC family transcriptional regulator of arabinose operon